MQHLTRIHSADNQQFKQLKKLASSARERRKTGLSLLDGVHLLNALAQTDNQPSLLVLRQGAEQDAEIAACAARFSRIKTLLLDAPLFNAVSPVETPVGILAVLPTPRPKPQDCQCAVLLENIQDPGNLGSVLRSAAAAGVEAAYLSRGCGEAWSPRVLRAGMGAHFVLRIYEQQPLAQVASGFKLSVATSLQASQSIYELALQDSVAFIFGNEGAGLSPELAAAATHRVAIPMPGNMESLNVAAASAICFFERVRQLQRKSTP